MNGKRLIMFCGHYGSGKTNIAVNTALFLRKQGDKVALADLDIVNPYFRAKDSKPLLEENGIRFICSEYANSNVDIPALPPDFYSITDDKTEKVVMDIGGDDRGALVLGRLVPEIIEENSYEMLFVVNFSRPLTPDAGSALEIMREIETACRLPFTGIVNNTNIGRETTAKTVIKSEKEVFRLSSLSGLPIVATTVREDLLAEVSEHIKNIFPIELQKNIYKGD